MALFLVIGLVAMDAFGWGNTARGESGVSDESVGVGGVAELFGGINPQDQAIASEDMPAALGNKVVLQDSGASGNVIAEGSDPSALSSGMLEGGVNLSGLVAGGGGVISYVVKKGDTLSKIAANFGISVETMVNSNSDLKTRRIKVGQTLMILPVSGILYAVRDGETAESVAAAFGLTVNQLQQFNSGVSFANIGAGMTLVIPGATSKNAPSSLDGALPNLPGYFAMPTNGFNWGILHPQNAVDIAATCGTPIVSSAEGLVSDISMDDWSGGYGHYVQLEHPNGTKTKYAHMDKITVSLGDYVKQSDALGTMGQTGDATGCHVHFEISGAKNPFAK